MIKIKQFIYSILSKLLESCIRREVQYMQNVVQNLIVSYKTMATTNELLGLYLAAHYPSTKTQVENLTYVTVRLPKGPFQFKLSEFKDEAEYLNVKDQNAVKFVDNIDNLRNLVLNRALKNMTKEL